MPPGASPGVLNQGFQRFPRSHSERPTSPSLGDERLGSGLKRSQNPQPNGPHHAFPDPLLANSFSSRTCHEPAWRRSVLVLPEAETGIVTLPNETHRGMSGWDRGAPCVPPSTRTVAPNRVPKRMRNGQTGIFRRRRPRQGLRSGSPLGRPRNRRSRCRRRRRGATDPAGPTSNPVPRQCLLLLLYPGDFLFRFSSRDFGELSQAARAVDRAGRPLPEPPARAAARVRSCTEFPADSTEFAF
jgi:hypothetical protein